MMRILFGLFVAIGFINLAHFCWYLTSANIYDVLQFKRLRELAVSRHKSQPTVTVLVPAHNEEAVIIRCLESVCNSTYSKLQIIVIDDASSDATRHLVHDYIVEHPKDNICLKCKRKNGGKASALNYALKSDASGDLVMTLDADSILATDAIDKAVAYFDDPRVVGLAANVRIIEELTILGFLQRLEHMVGYRSKKAHSLFNCEFIVGGVASTYRMSSIKEVGFYDEATMTEDIGLSMKVVAGGNRTHRLVYAADVVAMTEGVSNFKALIRQRFRWKYGNLQNIIKHRRLLMNPGHQFTRMLTFYRMPMAIFGEVILLLEPVVLCYVLYLTAKSHNLSLIIGSYTTITIYVWLTLWPDEYLNFRNRVRLSLYAPVAYFIFYIMNVVQLVAIVRCLYKLPQLLSSQPAVGHWTSPQRVGRKQVTIG
ncbi:MAG TPA: glycosyltransferase [Patescibacteria group bacterium]|jgi:biofilm PGA synthesis N-glycosyltransferase PgaC|nr:glycosyltransferase [Patescibacteria group bacterium]